MISRFSIALCKLLVLYCVKWLLLVVLTYYLNTTNANTVTLRWETWEANSSAFFPWPIPLVCSFFHCYFTVELLHLPALPSLISPSLLFSSAQLCSVPPFRLHLRTLIEFLPLGAGRTEAPYWCWISPSWQTAALFPRSLMNCIPLRLTSTPSSKSPRSPDFRQVSSRATERRHTDTVTEILSLRKSSVNNVLDRS